MVVASGALAQALCGYGDTAAAPIAPTASGAAPARPGERRDPPQRHDTDSKPRDVSSSESSHSPPRVMRTNTLLLTEARFGPSSAEAPDVKRARLWRGTARALDG